MARDTGESAVLMPARVHASLWMLGAIASFTLMAVAGRVTQAELSSFELMFWRSLIGFFIIAGVLVAHLRSVARIRADIRPTRPSLHLLRNVFHFAAYALSSALLLAPASTVAPMEFLRLPVIALVGVWLYSEPLEVLVFIGAAIILSANWINLKTNRTQD